MAAWTIERLDERNDGQRLIEDLGRVCVALADLIDCDSLELWNGDPTRTRDEVVYSLDAASHLLPATARLPRALVGEPRVPLLDEPTSALDPVGRRIVAPQA